MNLISELKIKYKTKKERKHEERPESLLEASIIPLRELDEVQRAESTPFRPRGRASGHSGPQNKISSIYFNYLNHQERPESGDRGEEVRKVKIPRREKRRPRSATRLRKGNRWERLSRGIMKKILYVNDTRGSNTRVVRLR